MNIQLDFLGQTFGYYKLVKLIASGGHARVYLGEHEHAHTKNAIKVLLLSNIAVTISPEDQINFLNEAKTLVSLSHPHIIKILDFGIKGEFEGLKCSIPFIVMSYAPYGTLRQAYPSNKRMPLDKVAFYITQVASALQYAHDENVVHLDVKPENMLFMAKDEIVLSDFGIAVANHKTTEFPIAQSGNQQSVKVFGSVGYMARERFFGTPSRSSDQYALAVVAYEWLTGSRPFTGADIDVMVQHVHKDPPPIHDRYPDVSEEIEAIIMKALEKDAVNRYPTVSEFALKLDQAIQNSLQQAAYAVQQQPQNPKVDQQQPNVGANQWQRVDAVQQQPNVGANQWQYTDGNQQPQNVGANQPTQNVGTASPQVSNASWQWGGGGAGNQGAYQKQGQVHLSSNNPSGSTSSGNTTYDMDPLRNENSKAGQQNTSGFEQFKQMFRFVEIIPPGVRQQLRTSHDFQIMPEYFWFRVWNYGFILLCGIGLTIDLWHYLIFLPLLLPLVMIPIFYWFVGIVKRSWALAVGCIVSVYYGLGVWAIVDIFQFVRPLTKIFPLLEFVLSTVAVVVSFLFNRYYVYHRLPDYPVSLRR